MGVMVGGSEIAPSPSFVRHEAGRGAQRPSLVGASEASFPLLARQSELLKWDWI